MEGFHEILVTDAYTGYEKVENITYALYFTPARRYWMKSIPLDNKGKDIAGSIGAIGRKWCDKLFKIKREIKYLPPEERLTERRKCSRQVFEAYFMHGSI